MSKNITSVNSNPFRNTLPVKNPVVIPTKSNPQPNVSTGGSGGGSLNLDDFSKKPNSYTIWSYVDEKNDWVRSTDGTGNVWYMVNMDNKQLVLDRYYIKDSSFYGALTQHIRYTYGTLAIGKYFAGAIGFNWIYCNLNDATYLGWKANNKWNQEVYVIKEGLILESTSKNFNAFSSLQDLFKVLLTPPISFHGEMQLIKSFSANYDQTIIINLGTEVFEGQQLIEQITTGINTSIGIGASISASVSGVTITGDINATTTWASEMMSGKTISTNTLKQDSITISIDLKAGKTYNIYCIMLYNDLIKMQTNSYYIECK